jgi:hypothetical protein
MFMKYPQQLTNHLIEWYGFWLVVFVADRLSDCRYLSRCCSPLDSQRVRCREGLAMKSFLIGLFGLTLFPAIGAACCPLRWPSNPASRWRWTTPVRHRADRFHPGW